MAGRRWGLCRTDGAKSRAVVFSGGPPADAAQIGMNLDAADAVWSDYAGAQQIFT